MPVVGLALLLSVALVPFLVGASIGAALARVPWGPAIAVMVGASIALPLFLSEYRSYTPDDYDSLPNFGLFFAFILLAGFIVWILGVGTGVVIGRLHERPAQKR